MENAAQRHKAVQFALAMTRGTAMAPSEYERQLLAQYVEGVLTIDQVIEYTEQEKKQKGKKP